MIEIINLSKKYKNKIIIDSSIFRINTNKVSFIMGPNGSGKTTLVKCIMGLESYSGQIIFNNSSNNSLVVWDDCPFYNNLSGIKNLILFSEGKIDKKNIINLSLKYLDNDLLNRKVKHYSYGQKKKLALALVEILKPKYLIMDEISNGLDYDTIKILKSRIKQWANNTTILLTGHQFDFYNDIIDEVFILKNNKILSLDNKYTKEGINLEDIYDKELH